MTTAAYLKTVLVLSSGGTAFAGYLTGAKLFSGTCAFNEPCPYFLGYPACWYGLALYLVMFVSTALGLAGKMPAAKTVRMNALGAGAGILFAGYFVSREIVVWMTAGLQRYSLFLPTCAYGLIFYIAIFSLSLLALRPKK